MSPSKHFPIDIIPYLSAEGFPSVKWHVKQKNVFYTINLIYTSVYRFPTDDLYWAKATIFEVPPLLFLRDHSQPDLQDLKHCKIVMICIL